jgi:hypothetical protein
MGLTVDPTAGQVVPGATQILTVTLDRTGQANGPFTGSIMIASPGGNETLTVDATVDSGPVIASETANPSVVYTNSACLKPAKHTAPTTSTVTAMVSGPEPLSEVVLHSETATGVQEPPSTMTGTGSTYVATLGPFTTMGTVYWWVTAIDNANATATSPQQQLTVAC